MKADIKLNMAQLMDTRQDILDYMGRLQELKADCEAFRAILDKQTSVSIEALSSKLQNGIMEQIQSSWGNMNRLQGMLFRYIKGMEDHIMPQDECARMRVDRNDIWYNIRQIEDSVTRLTNMGVRLYGRETVPDYWVYPADPDTEEARALLLEQELERQRRERNYEKIATASTSWMNVAQSVMESSVKSIWDIYNNNVVEFEEADDRYAKEAHGLYNEWANIGNRLVDLARREDAFLRGLGSWFKGMWEGICSLAICLVVYGSENGALAQVIEPDIPKEYIDRVEGMKEGYAMLWKDPFRVFEAIGQEKMDTLDEEGLVYMVGSVTPDLVIAVATIGAGIAMKRSARAAEMTDTMRMTHLVENTTDMGQTINHAEDMISTLDEIEEFYEGINRAQREINIDYEDYLRGLQNFDDVIGGGSGTRLIPGTEGIVTGGDSTKLGKNMMESMGLPRGTSWSGYQAQHIFPAEMAEHPVLQKIGMDLDDASNGLFLRMPADDISAMSRHRGYHSIYNGFVRIQLDEMDIGQSVDVLQKQVYELQQNLRKLQQNGLPLYPGQGASVDLWQRSLERIQ